MAFGLFQRAENLLEAPPIPSVLALDMPIGLPEAGGRSCDRLARVCLGSDRRNSVFPAPIRSALDASSHEQASEITQAIDGRRVSAQAWGLFPKIRQVDTWLRTCDLAGQRAWEAHPELSFWAWNEGCSMSHAKKTPSGREQRLRLAEAWLGPELLLRARGSWKRSELADDDILDAVANLWTAHRIGEGTAQVLPDPPPMDAVGLPMRIVY
ncbi:DUF429 domain-containing protein [Myxococcota bacterium]|nr:DUF429 domain-containing protein [Myxococcota bacterium]